MRIYGGFSIRCGVVGLLALVLVFSEPVEANDQEFDGNVAQVDLAGLEDDLRETDAIGLGEKLSLKRDLDRLVEEFRAFHQGAENDGIDELQSSFHQLVNKTLRLLRADDPELYKRISTSRSKLWTLLRNRDTFQAMVVIEEPTYIAM